MNIYDAIHNRRSVYKIGNEKTISEDRVVEIIEYILSRTPTAYNSKGNRIAVFFGENHNKIWDHIKSELKKIVPENIFKGTEKKMESMKAGFGTILFFDDSDIVQNLQETYSLYADEFPVWAQQSSAMLQYTVWTTLASEGLGVSLQHYSVFLDEFVKSEFDIPENWKLISEMPFGSKIQGPPEKKLLSLEGKLIVYK